MKLGELLIKAKVLNELQLKSALQEQAKWGGKLGEILVRMNFVTEDVLVKALSKLLNVPRVDLDKEPLPSDPVRRKIPHDLASDMNAVPLRLEEDGKVLVVAMADPTNVRQLDAIQGISKCKIRPVIAGPSQVARSLARAYEGEADVGPADEQFKVVDAQGRTVVKSVAELNPSTPAPTPRVAAPAPRPPAGSNPSALLQAVEETQRKEVAALRAMVDLLIEKGVFTRDEYIARVRK
jgi:hypothetical protein